MILCRHCNKNLAISVYGGLCYKCYKKQQPKVTQNFGKPKEKNMNQILKKRKGSYPRKNEKYEWKSKSKKEDNSDDVIDCY